MRRGWGWRAADRRAAAGARARDGGEGSLAAVAGVAEGECACASVRALPPQSLRLRNVGAGNGPARGVRRWGSWACRGVCGGSLLGPGGWAAPSRRWEEAGTPPESGREGRPGKALVAGGGRGVAAPAAPGPARHPQGSERPGGSGGSSGKFCERRSGQWLVPGPRGGTRTEASFGRKCG